jgi:hypothetical protein
MQCLTSSPAHKKPTSGTPTKSNHTHSTQTHHWICAAPFSCSRQCCEISQWVSDRATLVVPAQYSCLAGTLTCSTKHTRARIHTHSGGLGRCALTPTVKFAEQNGWSVFFNVPMRTASAFAVLGKHSASSAQMRAIHNALEGTPHMHSWWFNSMCMNYLCSALMLEASSARTLDKHRTHAP